MAEEITKEEMEQASQVPRPVRIAMTPLESVLEKETWDDVDIAVLVNHKHMLDDETLAKLGITKPEPLTPEEVAARNEELKSQTPDIETEGESSPETEVTTEGETATEEVATDDNTSTEEVTNTVETEDVEKA